MKIKKSQLKIIIQEIVEQTIQQLNESTNDGEWWIYPGGQSVFADGEVGDSNHEGYVIEHVSREIYEHFIGQDDDNIGYLSHYEDFLFDLLKNQNRLSEEDIEMWNTRGPTEVLIEKLLEDQVYKTREQAEFAVYIAWGASSKDGRDYAMKYLGWKRMTTKGYQTELQTWGLTNKDLSDMKSGLFDAWSGTDDGNEEEDKKHEITIEVRSVNRSYREIPLDIFAGATLGDIKNYRKDLPWMKETVLKSDPVMDCINFTSRR